MGTPRGSRSLSESDRINAHHALAGLARTQRWLVENATRVADLPEAVRAISPEGTVTPAGVLDDFSQFAAHVKLLAATMDEDLQLLRTVLGDPPGEVGEARPTRKP